MRGRPSSRAILLSNVGYAKANSFVFVKLLCNYGEEKCDTRAKLFRVLNLFFFDFSLLSPSSLLKLCKRNREPDLLRFLVLFRLCLKVSLWTGDALSLCANGFPPDLAFDVIDTSNVGDHIGLLNVLVCCAPRLKE